MKMQWHINKILLILYHFIISSFYLNTSFPIEYIDGLVQDCSISMAYSLEIQQTCTKPLVSILLQRFYYQPYGICITIRIIFGVFYV